MSEISNSSASVIVQPEKGAAVWMEPVSGEDYNKL